MLTTYWGNTNFGEKKDLGPPWELSHREGMGYFAIALRDFEAGELICSEKPVTHTPGWHPFTDVQIKRINADVGKLSEDEQQVRQLVYICYIILWVYYIIRLLFESILPWNYTRLTKQTGNADKTCSLTLCSSFAGVL